MFYKLKLSSLMFSAFISINTLLISTFDSAHAQGTIYFRSGFEDGTVSEWLEGHAGNHTGGSYVSSERPRTGKYSWVAHNDPSLPGILRISAKLLRWRFDFKQAYYSAWFYWPSSYRVTGVANQYVNFFQYKERTAPYDPTWIVIARGTPNGDQIQVHDWHGKKMYSNGIPLPKDRWFHVEAYFVPGRGNGQFIIWLDGKEIYRFTNINNLGCPSNPSWLMWGVGNYGEPGINKHIYVDDCVVSSYRIGPGSTPPPSNNNPGNSDSDKNNDDDKNSSTDESRDRNPNDDRNHASRTESNPGSKQEEISLQGNFPNPFNPVTTIEYSLTADSHVTVKVYNTSGQEIKTLVNQNQGPGKHTVVWDATDKDNNTVTSGLYIYRVEAGKSSASGRMMFLK
jgi:hypothetical protein